MKVNRRDFLKFTGGAVTGIAVSGAGVQTVSNLMHAVEEPIFPAPGQERWIPSICQQCPGGCGILVRLVGERAVKIEGNPLHPVNRGTLCPRGQSGLQVLYDPDRIKGPMKRIGQRGSGKWQEIGWEEALNIVSSKLLDIRSKGGPHTLAIVSGESRGLMATLLERFLDAFGSPNFLKGTSDASGETETAHVLTHGISHPLGYDLEKANYVLSFGTGLIEGWGSPVRAMRAYGALRQGRSGARAKIVQIESRLSTTGAKSDEWVPVHPNTEGAMALGIAYVIISERLYNREFIERKTFGFEDWTDEKGVVHTGFKNLVLKEYSLNSVSKITGVPVETILRLGREFATTRKSLAIFGQGGNVNYTRLYDDMAVHSLNAMVGNIDAEGGIIIQKDAPLSPLPEVQTDETGEKGRKMVRIDGALTDKFPFAVNVLHNINSAITDGKPYPLNALFIYRANPVFLLPEGVEFIEALSKVPFIVSFSSFMDETTELADIILPDHTYLERWQDGLASPTIEFSVCGLRQPVVQPIYNTMHTGDVLLSIAKKIGGSVRDAFPWNNFEEVLKESLKGLYEAKRGSVIGTAFEEKWGKMLERVGWWSPTYSSFDELWKQLVEKGGWWDPSYYYGDWDRIFQTPSKRFEFYSQVLSKKLEELISESKGIEGPEMERLLTQWGVEARGDKVFLPHYEAVKEAGDEKAFKFFLYPYEPLALLGGEGANQPFLQEIIGGHVQEEWLTWVEINPETAKELGISNGDMVLIESVKGRAMVKARLYPGAMPDVVNLPLGLGHDACGRWARGIGVNVSKLVIRKVDPLSGKQNWAGTRVRVIKV